MTTMMMMLMMLMMTLALALALTLTTAISKTMAMMSENITRPKMQVFLVYL